MRLVLATRNAHKAREFGQLLAPHAVVALPDDVELPPEDGDTFAANALGKARAAAAALGEHAIADDSGIEAAALGGAPGIYSARYAGEGATDQENLDKLLREVPEDGDRRVAYVCALVYFVPGRPPHMFEETCNGVLTHDPRGIRGFGYDPAFVPVEIDDGRTMAELAEDEKDAISHRGKAARAFRDWLQAQEAAA